MVTVPLMVTVPGIIILLLCLVGIKCFQCKSFCLTVS